jgi:hypothetical protein
MLVRMWGKTNPHITVGGNVNEWKLVWRFFTKLNIDLPYEPITPFFCIYPKECKSMYERDTSIPMFITALLIIAKLWNQPR